MKQQFKIPLKKYTHIRYIYRERDVSISVSIINIYSSYAYAQRKLFSKPMNTSNITSKIFLKLFLK